MKKISDNHSNFVVDSVLSIYDLVNNTMELNSKIESMNERTLSIIIDKENYKLLQEIAKFHNTKILNLVNIFLEEGIEKYSIKESKDTFESESSDVSFDSPKRVNLESYCTNLFCRGCDKCVN